MRRSTDRSVWRGWALLALVAAGCSGADDAETPGAAAEEPVVAFDTARVCIVSSEDTIPLDVEVAATEEQRAHGLMERDHLPPNRGMLFTYPGPQAPTSGYWMFRTRIPLDIAYLGADGDIRAIRTMQPCASPDPRWCESYRAGVEFEAALEVNQGFFASRGIGLGARVLWKDPRACARR